jgi:hypothetical protein
MVIKLHQPKSPRRMIEHRITRGAMQPACQRSVRRQLAAYGRSLPRQVHKNMPASAGGLTARTLARGFFVLVCVSLKNPRNH